MEIRDDLMLTAGPTITSHEETFVLDALRNGWNHHHSDYIRALEQTFADYVGTRYAMATSSCTGAMHLTLAALGVGLGDEVIVPECTWIATAAVATYVGATPVFADIDRDTWVIDPASLERAITPRTRAIIPVDLYGNPCDIDAVNAIADKHGLFVVQDAAPAIGAECRGKRTGSAALAGCYSFQGAKMLVTGEGGMFVTNDQPLYERVSFLNNQGRDPNRALWNIEIGYKYKMSNLQAALGVGQVQRADEMIARKRQIFEWYHRRLHDVPGLALNIEPTYGKSIYWMTTIVLPKDAGLERDAFIDELRRRKVDSRPFFHPLSSMPMFDSMRDRNPVAYEIAPRAVNLPSGHERTEEDIDYACAHIRDVLGCPKGTARIGAEHAFRRHVAQTMAAAKQGLELPFSGGRLRAIGYDDLDRDESIARLAAYREKANPFFPVQFRVNLEGTRKWCRDALLATPDRVLFWVDTQDGETVGHVGLFRFDAAERACETDNIIRGVEGTAPGIIGQAIAAMHDWAIQQFDLRAFRLRVMSDNARAIRLYERLGYREIQRMPLKPVERDGDTMWVEVAADPYREIERYFVTMRLWRTDWEARTQ